MSFGNPADYEDLSSFKVTLRKHRSIVQFLIILKAKKLKIFYKIYTVYD
jgi:hypothetical protein